MRPSFRGIRHLAVVALCASPALAVPAWAQIKLPTTGPGPYSYLSPNGGQPYVNQPTGNLSYLYSQKFLAASHNSDYLTLEEARKAHLTWVVNHFNEVDTSHRGSITLADLHRYLLKQPGYPSGNPAAAQVVAPGALSGPTS